MQNDKLKPKKNCKDQEIAVRRKPSLCLCGIVFLIFISMCVLSLAENSEKGSLINISAEVNRSEVNVGDRIKLKLIAENASDYEVLFPENLKETGDFSFVESQPVKNRFGKVIQTEKEYILTIFETGIHVIPPVNVDFKKNTSMDWQTASSPQVPIDVKTLLTGNDTDIKDLKGLIYARNGGIYFILAIGLIFLILTAAWIFFKRREKQQQRPKEIKKTAHEIAYEELKTLRLMNLPEKGLIEEYYVRLSDIVRHYIENRFSLRAPEMTTEEFLYAVKNFPVVEPEHKELLKRFLFQCDMVKFARYGPTKLEMIDSFNSAENFVNQTKLEEQEEARK
ncbi:MAG: hypothetical protein ABIH09_05445 [Candidatus Omnitrophota bacterium]